MIVTITAYEFKLRCEVSGESVSKGKITILMMKTLMLTTMMDDVDGGPVPNRDEK